MPERNLIPLYDDTAAIACTIGDAEIPDRITLVERMRTNLTSIDRTPTGLLLHFPDQAEVRGDLATFAVDEKRCCQFWGFAIVDEPAGVALRWDGPPTVGDLLDRLHDYFTGDAPLTILDGLF